MYNSSLNTYNSRNFGQPEVSRSATAAEISGSPKSHARPLRVLHSPVEHTEKGDFFLQPLLGKSQQNGPDVRLGESRPRAIMKLKARWIARIVNSIEPKASTRCCYHSSNELV
ncbi:hypothetical protein HBH74_205200 [Parastagonospora nodorum]|nr:hypothetical protein HBI06_223080 [Parastagonospora nodorum]KAH4226206.1 hypothetical protein HBI05_224750 [Parastagonospora nodorum]KAH4892737.1 hypothetical protein HBH74_205200 [Parastagonospora nodorum]KAH5089621.1 hypothetical protein HBH72_225990 [Parastagonospora nodorum]KAH5590346.1 hypothetical protein HBI45_215010 [Parastagonospora nodorum]